MALAIFDLDETLIDGDCASLWAREMAKIGWVDGESFLRKDAELMAEYAFGRLAMEDYMIFSLTPLVGRTADEVAHVVAPFVEEVIEPLIYSDAMRHIAEHRKVGDRILIISASAEFLVKAIAARLGVEDTLAIQLEEQYGFYNGRTLGVLSYREGKVTRLRQWATEHGESLEGVHFYSDSINDLPLLEQVAYPHVVNPDPLLREQAGAKGWPQLSWT
ncbi:HAD family hydrolase [Pseudomonas sp. SST3]|uniref:HAD family hydrolase n=1 Tax=Pseudomonas sp. SST3 TaxID=2267882 RepID=UPI000E03E8E1|nr:HAD family hydrolase [Pseudomonas sp. SST3]NKQ09444.1 HAD family hydrolase [Pseudomonas sp. SST3]